MMNFDDLRLIDKKKIVFMPSNLRCKFSEILAEKRPDIEQESIGRMSGFSSMIQAGGAAVGVPSMV